MSQQNLDVVRRMLDAFNRNDVDAVVAAFDQDCEVREPSEMPDTPPSGFHGHDGIREWMTNLREVGDAHFEPRSFSGAGDVLLAELAGRGRGQAVGVPFEWTTFAVFNLRDGRILRVQAFLNIDEAREAAAS
jgi:uncharacterized protein